MTWVTLVDGVTADADELMTNFYHVAQGDVLPRASNSFVSTSGAYDLGSSAYRWNKIYVNELAATCTVTGEMVFNGLVTFSTAPVFGTSMLATVKKVVCEYTVASGTLPGRLRGSTLYTTTSMNTTTVNQIVGATLTSNQLTLPAGNYACSFYLPVSFTTVGHHARAVLFNATASTTVGLGSLAEAVLGSAYSVCLFDTFTLATSSALEMRVSTSDPTTTSGYAGGHTLSFGDKEQYLRLFVYQL